MDIKQITKSDNSQSSQLCCEENCRANKHICLNSMASEIADQFLSDVHNDKHIYYSWLSGNRLGKSVTSLIAFVETAIRYNLLNIGNNNHIIACQSSLNGIQLYHSDLIDICSQYGLKVKVSGVGHTHFSIFDKTTYDDSIIKFRIYVVGGAEVTSWKKISGLPFTNALLDEVMLLDKHFVDTVSRRLDYDESKVFYLSNGMSSSNPHVKLFTEKDESNKRGIYFSERGSNKYFSKLRESELLNFEDKSDFMYKRNVLGLIADAEGLCIKVPSKAVIDFNCELSGIAVFDEGIAGVTACLLFVPTDYGFHIKSEYYHIREQSGLLTTEQHVESILNFWNVDRWIVDSAAAGTKSALNNRGLRYENSLKHTLESIRLVNNSLNNGELTIDIDGCPNLLNELSLITWNPKTDRPVTNLPDHLFDCIRYGSEGLLNQSSMVGSISW